MAWLQAPCSWQALGQAAVPVWLPPLQLCHTVQEITWFFKQVEGFLYGVNNRRSLWTGLHSNLPLRYRTPPSGYCWQVQMDTPVCTAARIHTTATAEHSIELLLNLGSVKSETQETVGGKKPVAQTKIPGPMPMKPIVIMWFLVSSFWIWPSKFQSQTSSPYLHKLVFVEETVCTFPRPCKAACRHTVHHKHALLHLSPALAVINLPFSLLLMTDVTKLLPHSHMKKDGHRQHVLAE